MKIIDQDVIDSLIEIGDKEFLTELIDIFLSQSEELIQEINQAAAANNSQNLMKSSHKLKGSCLNLGALGLGAICQDLEVMSKKEDLSTLSEVMATLDKVYQETVTELIRHK